MRAQAKQDQASIDQFLNVLQDNSRLYKEQTEKDRARLGELEAQLAQYRRAFDSGGGGSVSGGSIGSIGGGPIALGGAALSDGGARARSASTEMGGFGGGGSGASIVRPMRGGGGTSSSSGGSADASSESSSGERRSSAAFAVFAPQQPPPPSHPPPSQPPSSAASSSSAPQPAGGIGASFALRIAAALGGKTAASAPDGQPPTSPARPLPEQGAPDKASDKEKSENCRQS